MRTIIVQAIREYEFSEDDILRSLLEDDLDLLKEDVPDDLILSRAERLAIDNMNQELQDFQEFTSEDLCSFYANFKTK